MWRVRWWQSDCLHSDWFETGREAVVVARTLEMQGRRAIIEYDGRDYSADELQRMNDISPR